MKEQQGKSEALLFPGLNWENISPALFIPCQLNLGPDYYRKQRAVHHKWCDCWIRCRDNNAQQLPEQKTAPPPPALDADKKARTNTAADSIPDCLVQWTRQRRSVFILMELDCEPVLMVALPK